MYTIGYSVRLKIFLVALGLVFQTISNAASFNHQGEDIASSIAIKTIDCGKYKVEVVHESFPFKYENYVPEEFFIKGFYGSVTTVSKQAIIRPEGIVVPNANDIDEIQGSYPENRTYLAGSAACKGSQLIISYWSGGNCSQCEAYVSFEVYGSKLINPKKVTYREFQALSQ